MNVISIGTDRKILETGSGVEKRQVEYGKLFSKLDIVVVNRGQKAFDKMITENVMAHSTPSLWGVFSRARKLSQRGIISTQDPFETGFIGVLLKLFCGVPLHVQLHTDFNNKYFLLSSPLNCIRFFLGHIVLPYADSVRVVSNRVKENIQELATHIDVLPIHVDVQSQEGIIKKPFSVVTVARLEKEKDLFTAVRAFALASKSYPEAVFTIAGEGSLETELKNLVKELGIEYKVNFIGWVSDLPQLYGEHQIYISTSLFEGYGMSIVEAAQSGCALVLSDAGIAGEIPGAISKPKDVSGFAYSLEKLFADQELTRTMGAKAKEVSSGLKISWATYLTLYRENIEHAGLYYKERSFLGRVVDFVSRLFRANKVLRFLVGGTTAASTQIFFLYLFTSFFDIWYLYSSVLSFCIAFVVSFLLQKLWVFQDKEVEGSHIQFFKYIIVGVLGIALNTFVMYVFVTVLGLWYILAQVVSGMIVAVANFFAYKIFIFKNK